MEMNGVAFSEPKNLLWKKSPNRLRHLWRSRRFCKFLWFV